MPFQDLDELLGSSKKELPIGGRLVTFPSRISAETALILLRISEKAHANREAAADGDALVAEIVDEFNDNDAWLRAQRDILGRAPEELIAEGLTADALAHVTKTLVTWHLYGQDTAEKAWRQVGNPPAPNRQTRRAASKAPAKSSRSRGSRAGSTTPPPATATADRPGVSSSPTGD